MPVFHTEEHSYAACPCCDEKTTVSKGAVTTSKFPEAQYWVRWSEAHPENPMLFVIDLPDSQHSVANLYLHEIQSFMVIGPDKPLVDLSVIKNPLNRSDVIGTPLATQIFAYLDEIYLHDLGVSAYISRQENPTPTENPTPAPPSTRHLWLILIIIAAILFLVLK